MSRCFSYPPPGYLRQGFAESIKLENEKVPSKREQRLHKRSEKKQKKKERERKDKTHGLTEKFKHDDSLNVYKDDQLENSDLTEEHGPPVCYTSDGSQNSNKRKRETLFSSECRVNGNALKIRFTLKKPCQSAASLSEETVSTSVRLDSTREQCSSWSIKANTVTHVPEQNLWHNDERRAQIPSSETSVRDSEMQKAALPYESLIEGWMPPLVELSDDSGDNWLFKVKQQGETAAKTSKVDSGVTTCRGCATSWPSAQFVSEADIYALPYTIPF
ncbi:hypothetical protein Golax_008149 [Gossypium laxum]|uniref:Uncharacterized protein n=1 Tax=Gossypium laxum TaxID=34288 RepID=A0A7J9A8Z7_9ROSI|nr:hypothetical protein [Gossypium laxum]